jgi:DNA polymerase-3 subunit epsilon
VNPCTHIPPQITELTGICDADVIGAPTLHSLIHEIDNFLDDHVIIGHNIPFDLSFLQYAYQRILGSKKAFQYIDTLSLSQAAYPHFPSHKLNFLKSKLNIEAGRSHRAMNDVICTNQLLNRCLSSISSPMNRLLQTFHYRDIKLEKYENVTPSMMKPACTSFDSNHPLFGKTIVFTGTFSRSKDCLMQMALDIGASVKTSVSSKTHVLVVGKQDISVVGNNGMSTKQEKAYTLNESGRANIMIIEESEFLDLANAHTRPVLI